VAALISWLAAFSFEPDMCILCDTQSLRLLVAPLRSLSHLELVESIRVAREAAMQIVYDTADAMGDEEDTGAEGIGGPDAYIEYIVERAEESGTANAREVRAWMAAEQDRSMLLDPRVQAFLSSGAEGFAAYRFQIRGHRTILERFLELLPGTVVFGGIGPSGEIAFDHGEERHIVLSDEEAMLIAVDRLSLELWREDPARLLPYTSLPDGAEDVIVTAQKRTPDEANDILVGIVDVRALAEDTVRRAGYGPLIAPELVDDLTEQRFGDHVILRTQRPENEFGG
jgi:hypothetical protein